MKIPVEASTLRFAAEVMADQAIETGNAELAQEALNIMNRLRTFNERVGAAELIESDVMAIIVEDH